MTRKLGISIGMLLGFLILTSATPSVGQQRQAAPDRVVIQRDVVFQGPEGLMGPSAPVPGNTFDFVAMEVGFDGKLVKKAPYSAQAVTETTQTLSDGNRIVNKFSSSLYRDSEGRTRREQTLKVIGSFANGSEPLQRIFISDPVAGVSYTLDPHTHIAHKMPPMRFEFKFAPPPQEGEGPAEALNGPRPPERPEPPPGLFLSRVPPPPPVVEGGMIMEWHGTREVKGQTESLGKQTIEGVEAEGTKNTVTIPAGEIGNERAIEIISERWYSPELQIVIMSRQRDPRFGETVYRLTNINRAEPAPSLFEVPADYTVKEGPVAPEPLRMRKPVNNPQ